MVQCLGHLCRGTHSRLLVSTLLLLLVNSVKMMNLILKVFFFELSMQLEQEEKQDGVQESTLKETLPRQRFAKPTSKKDFAAVWKASMPKRTQNDTAYCMKVWKEWRHCRVGKAAQENNPITSMSRPVM